MHYKAPDNSIHFLDDDNFIQLLPAGSVPISDAEAALIIEASKPIVDPKEAIRAQIKQLEADQLMPRATREFMLLYVETNGLTAMPGYAPLKAFDEQIKALRAQL